MTEISKISPIDEIGKYTKKRQSNVSKSKAKSKHKHIYKSCLIQGSKNPNLGPYLAKYCTCCGKIDNWIIITEKENNYHRALSREEILDKYSYLPLVEVEDIWQKYIPI